MKIRFPTIFYLVVISTFLLPFNIQRVAVSTLKRECGLQYLRDASCGPSVRIQSLSDLPAITRADYWSDCPAARGVPKLDYPSDIAQLVSAYGTCVGDPAYDPDCDIDGDDCVKIFDAVMMVEAFTRARNRVLVLVSDEVFSQLESRLERYADDVDGFELMIVSGSWTEPVDVRTQIQEAYAEFNISGCILVGDIVAAYYRSVNVHGTFVFPTDLYYMDLDGTWVDYEPDGVFDNRTDPDGVEIWVSRIKLPIDSVLLLQIYFDKSHQYYTNPSEDYENALIYTQTTLDYTQHYRVEIMERVYNRSDITLLCESNATKANYVDQLGTGFEVVWMSAHGAPTIQLIEENPSVYFDGNDAKNIENGSILYLLHNCGVGRYDVEDYLAGWYVFGKSYGLTALASTTDWESIDIFFFISAIGKTYVGEAFLETIRQADELAKTNSIVARNLYYGAVLIGDPFIEIGKSIGDS